MRFFLMGFMGSGKSSVGKKLAVLLNLDFYDLDEYISEAEDCSISDLFTMGEDGFRKLESHYLGQLINKHNNCVVALGGGTPCYYGNLELILSNGIAVYFELSEDVLFSRLVHLRSERPLISELNDAELRIFIERTLKFRTPFYTQAQYKVNAMDLKGRKLKELALQLSHVRTT